MQLPSMEDFLRIFSYYLCPRCTQSAGTEQPQIVPEGSGRHAHNGEILQYLAATPPSSTRILSAYAVYLAAGRRQDLQKNIAQAYNNPQPYESHNSETLAVRNLIDYRHSVWLRHGVETFENARINSPGELYPPLHTRHTVGEAVSLQNQHLGRYAVDTDRFPFVQCSLHGKNSNWQQTWDTTAAYLPIELYNHSLHHPKDRDHYYAVAQVPAKRWTHILWDIPHNLTERNSAKHYRQQLQQLKLPAVHYNTVQRLNTVLTHLDIHAQLRPRVA